MSNDENAEVYNRWQTFRINQLTLCISLFLTFAVATLGFSLNLLIQPTFPISGHCAKIAFFFFALPLGLFSVFLGSLACVVRLWSFRATAFVARHRGDDTKAEEVRKNRNKYQNFDDWTWRLFYGQLVFFALQVLALLFALEATYWTKVL